MVKRIIRIIAAALLLPVLALAAPQWKEDTPAMAMLRDFTGKVNEILQEHGEGPINSLFGNFPQVTVMGITGEDDAEIPEGVEITVSMFYDTLATLELRVNDLGRFPVIACGEIDSPEKADELLAAGAALLQVEKKYAKPILRHLAQQIPSR